MNSKVYIVILNWNGYDDTSECLESLKKIEYSNYRVIVVDNGSPNNDAQRLKNRYSDYIDLIESQENLGFSGGNNLGIRKALDNNADYIVLLNNDTIVEENFLSLLVSSARTSEKIGITTPKINYYSQKSKIWSAGGEISKIRGSGFSKGEKRNEKEFYKNRFITFASGCCLLIKKEVIEKVGLLDEKYFLYLEDADYCLRVVKKNYKILFVAESKIYHKVNSTTTYENSYLPIYYNTRNRLYFSKKLLSNWYYFVKIYLFITMLLKSIIWNLKSKKELVIIVKRAFKDFKDNKMGKVNGLL